MNVVMVESTTPLCEPKMEHLSVGFPRLLRSRGPLGLTPSIIRELILPISNATYFRKRCDSGRESTHKRDGDSSCERLAML